MNYKFFRFFLAATLLAVSTVTPAQNSSMELSLEQAQELALQNNQSVKNALLDIEMANYKVDEIRAMGLPQIEGSGVFSHTYEIATQLLPGDFVGQPGTMIATKFGVPFNLSGTVQLNQLLFDGTFFLGLQAASEFVNVNRLMASKSEIDVKEGVTKAYYMALISDDNLRQLQNSLSNLYKIKNETSKMYEAGMAERLDVDRLILSVSNLEISINNLRSQATLAKQILLNSMGIDVNQPIVLTSKLPEFNMDNFREGYGTNGEVSNRIEYKMLEQQQKLNELDLKRWKVGYFPSLYGMVNYGGNSFGQEDAFNDLGKDWYPNGMWALSLKVPIFDGLKKQAKINQARVEIEKTKNSMTQLTNGIELEISQSRNEYSNAYKTLELQKQSMKLAENIYKTTSIKFKEGVGSSFEMITAEGDLTSAKSNYLNALYNLSVAKINLDKALGNITNN